MHASTSRAGLLTLRSGLISLSALQILFDAPDSVRHLDVPPGSASNIAKGIRSSTTKSTNDVIPSGQNKPESKLILLQKCPSVNSIDFFGTGFAVKVSLHIQEF